VPRPSVLLLVLAACAAPAEPPATCEAPPPPPDALLKLSSVDPLLLPSGRALTPAGRTVHVGGYPTDVVVGPTGTIAYVADGGRYRRGVTVVDLERGPLQHLERDDGWFGMALSPDGSRLYAAGGAGHDVEVFDVSASGRLRLAASIPVGGYPAGLALTDDGGTLYVARYQGSAVAVVDTVAGEVVDALPTSQPPFRPLVVGDTLWVDSLTAGTIEVLDRATGDLLQTIRDVDGADGMVTDGATVWVAASAIDEIRAFDAASGAKVGTASVAADEHDAGGAPLMAAGPTTLALDGDRLLVALAGDDAVAVLDAATLAELGRFPVGWYPDGIAVSSVGAVVANARGVGMGPNVDGDEPSAQYKGTISIVDVEGLDLAAATEQVTANRRRPSQVYPMSCDDAVDPSFPIPLHPGDPTPIEHVVLIVRENKTFDSELADLDLDVDADPSKLLFGEDVTPNLHALARRFTVGDDFYTDSEVSTQGHVWLTRLFVTDFLERSWMEDYHGGGDFGRDAAFPGSVPGYGSFFTHLVDHDVDFRVYGEIVGATDVGEKGAVIGHVDLGFPGGFFNTGIQDETKAGYVADRWDADGIPTFAYVLLPNDHTNGAGGTPDPVAMIHDNDVGAGLLIDRISHHPDWEKTVVFLVEDDPQQGADHVDMHRSYVIVASPWAKPGHVTHVLGSYTNLFATIERILGLPPLNRYDAWATPMWDAFTSTPDPRPFDHVASSIPWNRPPPPSPVPSSLARVDRFTAPDRDPLLGEELWWHVKGAPPAGGRLEAALRAGELDDLEVEDDDEDAWLAAQRSFDTWIAAHPEARARYEAARSVAAR
jgi:YVTN family beta-propeller protein